MWSRNEDARGVLEANSGEPLLPASQEVNSVLGHEDASSEYDSALATSAHATKKRRRQTTHHKTSCETCKARKVKCDRSEPACSWCARHNRTCVYLERQKPGSRAGFNSDLEAKVNRIDALLQALGRRVEEHIGDVHASGPQEPSACAPNRASPQINESRRDDTGPSPVISFSGSTITCRRGADGLCMSSPDAAVGSPWTNGLVGGQSSAQGHRSFQRTESCDQLKTFPSIPGSGRVFPVQPYLGDLPPHDILYTLVDLYFKHCNTWCPILDRKSTFGTFFGSTSLEEPDRILLHAIVATTLRFLKDPRLSPEMKAHYHGASRHIVQTYALDNISVQALRALVIICLDELGTSNGPRGWNLLALLAQNVRQLDLYEESSVFLTVAPNNTPSTGSIRRIALAKPQSWIEDEGVRRLCWMVYVLDRYATIATTSFDFMLDDCKMRRVLPCSYDLFSRNVPVETRSRDTMRNQQNTGEYVLDKPENLGSFSYHCEILTILSKVHDFLKAPVDITSSNHTAEWRNRYQALDQELDAWLQSLPSEYGRISALCHSDPGSRVANWFILHSAYVTSVVRLHSSAAYPTAKSQFFVPSDYAMQRCLSAVQSLGDITRDVLEADGLDLLGPPFAFSLWVGARLLLVHAAAANGPVDPKIDFFIDTLRNIGQHWEVAGNYSNILTRMVERSQQNGMGVSSMRRNAHDLVTLTSMTRRSGLEQTSSQATSLAELDNIDVFEFFNLPKVLNPTSVSLP